MSEEGHKKRVGRPPLDTRRAAQIAARIGARLAELGLNPHQFSRRTGIDYARVRKILAGKASAENPSIAPTIVAQLGWTIDELKNGPMEWQATTASLERVLAGRFADILQQPVIDPIASGKLISALDRQCLLKAVDACSELLPLTRLLSSAPDIKGIRQLMTAIREVARAADLQEVPGGTQLLFDVSDRRSHSASYTMPGLSLVLATRGDISTMADKMFHDGEFDPELALRFLVRRADVLKISGEGRAAFQLIKSAMKLAEDYGLTRTLSYIAFRTGCTLAAEYGDSAEFDAFVDRAKKAAESGYLPIHEVCTVLEGISDAFSLRRKSGLPCRYSKQELARRALEHYGRARETFDQLAALGRDHPEYRLRFAMRPLTLYDAGINDLVSEEGTPAPACCENLTRVLIVQATGSDRTEMKLRTMLAAYTQ